MTFEQPTDLKHNRLTVGVRNLIVNGRMLSPSFPNISFVNPGNEGQSVICGTPKVQ